MLNIEKVSSKDLYIVGKIDEAMLEHLTNEQKSNLGQGDELYHNTAQVKKILIERFPTHTMAEQVSNV